MWRQAIFFYESRRHLAKPPLESGPCWFVEDPQDVESCDLPRVPCCELLTIPEVGRDGVPSVLSFFALSGVFGSISGELSQHLSQNFLGSEQLVKKGTTDSEGLPSAANCTR